MNKLNLCHYWVAEDVYINRPYVVQEPSTLLHFGIEGDKLELLCIVHSKSVPKIDMKWTLPNNNIAIAVRRMLIYFNPYE